MQKLVLINSRAVPLPSENIDTDQIIPARFLKSISKEGFGENLFRDWRYNVHTNEPNADFVLNNSKYSGEILVAGNNFGCGSSREHAAWALTDYGFKVVVSSYFADIFKGNCLNIGVLPVQISPEFSDTIFKAIEADSNTQLEINLPEQTITLLATGQKESFDINGYKKNNMINGFDDIDYLQNIKKEIVEFADKLPY